MGDTPDKTAGPGRRWTFRILALGLGLVLSSVFAEIAVRLVDPPFFTDPLTVFHPELGWTGVPEMVAYRQTYERDQMVRYEINRLGFRGLAPVPKHEVWLNRNPERRLRRVVVLGDSFTEAVQVELQDTYWFRLGQRLNAHQRDVWQVNILANGDWGTLQQSLALERHGLEAKPDLVILQFFALNDIANNSLAAANIASSNDAFRPYLDPADDFRTITHVAPWTARLRSLSAAGRQATLVARHWFGPWGGERVDDFAARMEYARGVCARLGLPDDMQHLPILLNAYSPAAEQLPMVAEGWGATDEAVERIAEAVTGVGAELLVFDMPHPNLMARALASHATRLPYSIDSGAPLDRLAERLASRATPVDLYGPFEATPRRVLPYLDGHLDVDGHELVAEVLEAAVVELFPEAFPPPEASPASPDDAP